MYNNLNTMELKYSLGADPYLGLVSDEVDLWLGGLRGRGSGDDDVGLLLRFLHQHVNEGLLLVLRLNRDDGRGRRRRRRRLDEHYLVVLLRGRHVNGLAGSGQLVVWGRHMDVHVFVHNGRALGRPVLRRGRSVRRRGRRV